MPDVSNLQLTTQIVCAHAKSTPMQAEHLPELITSVFRTLVDVQQRSIPAPPQKPAVPIHKSIRRDALRMLMRYLQIHYGMSPEVFRRKWGLPADYPMVAPSFKKMRSEMSRAIRLRELGGVTASATAPPA